MNFLNKVILIGPLVREPVILSSSNNETIARVCLAIDAEQHNATGENEEYFTNIEVTISGRECHLATQSLRRGTMVLVEGRLQMCENDRALSSRQHAVQLSVVCQNFHILSSSSQTNSQNNDEFADRLGIKQNISPEPEDPEDENDRLNREWDAMTPEEKAALTNPEDEDQRAEREYYLKRDKLEKSFEYCESSEETSAEYARALYRLKADSGLFESAEDRYWRTL